MMINSISQIDHPTLIILWLMPSADCLAYPPILDSPLVTKKAILLIKDLFDLQLTIRVSRTSITPIFLFLLPLRQEISSPHHDRV